MEVQGALEGMEDAAVVAIGPGEPALLRELRGRLSLRVTLLSDPSFGTYRSYGLGRASLLRLLASPSLWRSYARLVSRGRRLSRPREDLSELGGDVIVDRAGRIAWLHRSRSVTDRPSAAEIARRLAAL